MSKKALKIDIKNRILNGARCLGNSNRGLKEICSDLVNDANRRGIKHAALCSGTFLSPHTIERISKLTDAEGGAPYRPNADTCERILKFFNAELTLSEVTIKGQYGNKPKG